MKPLELAAKARRAIASAKVLLAAGDVDGACNRAYYAMFDAARYALSAADAAQGADAPRTHGGLIAAFSLRLVKPGIVPLELGRALNKVEDLRLIADYKGDPLDPEIARWAVAQADSFVLALFARFPVPLPE